ncbi:MAG: hypothetical protein ACU4F9_01705 [Arcticibacter sp.]
MEAVFVLIDRVFVFVETALAFTGVVLVVLSFFCSLDNTLTNFLAISFELVRTNFEIDFAARALMVDKRPNTSSWISDSITFLILLPMILFDYNKG